MSSGGAEERGATILTDVESTDFEKHYRAENLEGHRWKYVELATVASR